MLAEPVAWAGALVPVSVAAICFWLPLAAPWLAWPGLPEDF
jgi:hypothetical protein